MAFTNHFEEALVLETFQPEQVLPKEEHVTNFLNSNGLNWEVQMEPLVLEDGSPTKFWGVTRQDTRRVFHAASDRYVPMQNRELAELAMMVADETSATIQATTSIYQGGLTFIEVGGEQKPIQFAKVGDIIQTMMTFWNSQDGSSSFGMGLRHKVLSCKNGMSFFRNGGKISVRHTQSLKDKVKSLVDGWHKISEYNQKVLGTMEQLSQVPATPQLAEKIIQIVIGKKPDEEVTTRTKNKIITIAECIKHEMMEKGATGWGLLNGVTYYTTHKTGNKDSHIKSQVFGAHANTNLEVFDYLSSLVK